MIAEQVYRMELQVGLFDALLSLMGCFKIVKYLKCSHQDLKNDSSTNSVAYPEVKL